MKITKCVPYCIAFFGAVACGRALADDFTAQTAGTYSFAPGVARGALVNAANDGLVTFAPDGETSADQRISFTSFDATVSEAQTTFDGGFWDFGATDDTTNFWTTTSTLSSRTTSLANGANITGIGTAWIAGPSGTDNTLALSGASSMRVRQLTFGAANDQRSKLSVTGGSSFTCEGKVYMSRASVSSDSQSRTDNELLVSGAQSKITVGGVLSIGGAQGGKNNWGYRGGNTVKVTDGATADLQEVEVGMGVRQGKFNKVVFGKDAHVTMTRLGVSTLGTYPVSSNTIEIVDGAAVTNTGALVFGRENKNGASSYNELFISNAVFSTESGYIKNGVNYLLPGANSEIRLSGRNAQIVSQQSIGGMFLGPGSRFVVENEASYTFPRAFVTGGAVVSDETLVVRSGATVSTTADLLTTNKGTNNTIVVDGGTLNVGETLTMAGYHASLIVRDGNVRASRSIYVGDNTVANSTNSLMVVQGSSPEIYAYYQLHIQNGSTLRFELPEEGYAAGYATTEKPVIMAGDASSEMGIKPDAGSRIEISGAWAMLNYFRTHDMRGEYVLMRTNQNISALDGLVEKLQQSLPVGMTVASRVKSQKWELVLTVKPYKGLGLIVK